MYVFRTRFRVAGRPAFLRCVNAAGLRVCPNLDDAQMFDTRDEAEEFATNCMLAGLSLDEFEIVTLKI